MKLGHILAKEAERIGGSRAALRRVPAPGADQPRGPELVRQGENKGPAMKLRAVIAYFCTIVAAFAFAVLFLWLGWALLHVYLEWSQQAPPHLRQDSNDRR